MKLESKYLKYGIIFSLQERLLDIESQNNNIRSENNELIQKINQAEDNNESIEIDTQLDFDIAEWRDWLD
jgi:hypothetical protein